MKLLDISSYCLLSIFHDWLAVSQVCVMNSAFCNKTERSLLIHLLHVKEAHPTSTHGANIGITIYSTLRNGKSRMDVIYLREVEALKQWSIFDRYHKENRLEKVCCMDRDTSITQLLFPKAKISVNLEEEKFVMWADVSATDCCFIVSRNFAYKKIMCRTNSPEPYTGFLASYIEKDQESFIGSYLNGKRHGYGRFREHVSFLYSNFNKYDGMWVDGKKEGYGIERSYDNSHFRGEWLNDMKNGHGVMIYSYGNVYEGEWKEDIKSGRGKMKYAHTQVSHNGEKSRMIGYSVYEGKWADDDRHGFGTMKYLSGDRYVGLWEDDLKCGLGEYFWADGRKWKGEFEKDAPKVEHC